MSKDSKARDAFDYSLQHLEAELKRIDLLLQRQVWRWQLAGQDPNDAFRGQYLSDTEASALLRRPFGTHWGHVIDLEPEDARAFAQAEKQVTQNIRAAIEAAQSHGQTPRLLRLAASFGLDRFDLDAFLICLAPALDLRYERLYAYLQDDVTRKRPRVNLALDLLCSPGVERLRMLGHFSDHAPLFKYHLVERASGAEEERHPLLSQTLVADQAVVAWLLGRYEPHVDIRAQTRLSWPKVNETDDLLAADVWPVLEPLLKEEAIFVFYGPDRGGQRSAARLCAAHLARPLLVVDLAAAVQEDLPAAYVLRLALRDAVLMGAVPYLEGWDACLVDKETPPPDVLATLCAYPGLAIVAGKKTWQPKGIERERSLFWFEFPVPAYAQRLALWRYFARTDGMTGEPGQEGGHLEALAGQFVLTSGHIRDAVATARDRAAQERRAMADEDLLGAARTHSNPRLASLARKIVPRYTWPDIVLPDDQVSLLHEIVDTVRGRPLVLEEWGVGHKLTSSAGVTMLFAGPPGTGKTMAAEVIANELRLDLYKIDLSTVVSKYIGETEKNLERIFNEAQSSNAILFFDEADAIFGKRSEVKDAHDRYANIEVSYLLQRMEAYDGVTILATNLRANLDEAFTRRLQFAVDFPFPEDTYRLRIWQTLFPENVPCDGKIDFELLARRFKLAGGNIRNIIVGATYLAAADGGRVEMKHMLHGTRRELQKMGRLVNEADLRLDKSE